MTTYCDYCNTHPEDTFNREYHDTQYGFPLVDDHLLFERLVLEINQAGLSWITILKKAESFRQAYDRFEIETITAYGETERARLLSDPGIIRNRLKVNAAIENARRIQALRGEFGSLKGWLDAHHPLSKDEWTKLFKKTQPCRYPPPEQLHSYLLTLKVALNSHKSIQRLYLPCLHGIMKS